MTRPEVNQEAIKAQVRHAALVTDFGPEIGHALWQYQGGLESLTGDDVDSRVSLMKSSEESLAEKIGDALDNDDPRERQLGVRALIRISTVKGE